MVKFGKLGKRDYWVAEGDKLLGRFLGRVAMTGTTNQLKKGVGWEAWFECTNTGKFFATRTEAANYLVGLNDKQAKYQETPKASL